MRLAYSPDEIVDLTGFSRHEVMRAIHSGELEAHKRCGRKYFATEAAVREWLESFPRA